MNQKSKTRVLKSLIDGKEFKRVADSFDIHDFNATRTEDREALSLLALANAKTQSYEDAVKICSVIISCLNSSRELTTINGILLCIGECKPRTDLFEASLEILVTKFGSQEAISISLAKLFLYLGDAERAWEVLFKVSQPLLSEWYSLALRSLEACGYHFEIKQLILERLDKSLLTTPMAISALKSVVIASTSRELHSLLEKILRIDPDDFSLLERVAWAYSTIGQVEKSIKLLEKAIEIGGTQDRSLALPFYRLAVLDPRRPILTDLVKNFAIDRAPAGKKESALKHFGYAEVARVAVDLPTFFNELRAGNNLLHSPDDRKICISRYDTEFELSMELSSALCGKGGVGQYTGPVIFIVGLPRCGSTVVANYIERNYVSLNLGELDSFRRIFGRWEQVADRGDDVNVWAKLFSRRWRALVPIEREKQNSLPLLIDKSLANFLHTDLISRMFPNCCILNLKRDFGDHVFGIYRRLFESSALAYTSSISDIKTMMSMEEDVVRRRLVSSQKLQVVNFEKLIANDFREIDEMLALVPGVEKRHAPITTNTTAPIISTSRNQVRAQTFVKDISAKCIEEYLPEIFD